MKRLRKLLALALAVGIASGCLPVDAFASARTISSVNLKVGVDFQAGDTLDSIDIRNSDNSTDGTFVYSSNSRYHISDAEWTTSDDREMAIGEQPRMRVTLSAEDSSEYAFRGGYQSSNVKVSGGTFISARRDGDDTLIVTLKVNGIKGTYDAPDDAYWRDSGIGMARWSSVDDSSGAYDVLLKRGNTVVKKVEKMKATSYNFYPYMTREGSYSFKVRTVPYTESQERYGKPSDWVESDEFYLPKEKVSDGSGQDAGNSYSGNTGQVGWIKDGDLWHYRYPDGTYLKNTWSKINGKWYLFDNSGIMLTGWQVRNHYWYYLNTSGDMYTGWLQDKGKWYYLNPSTTVGVEGAMATGWINFNNKMYYADGSGALVSGWYQIDGNWRYFYPTDYTMAVSTTIDTFPVDANGIWHKP